MALITGTSRARERVIQQRMFNRIALSLESMLSREIRLTMYRLALAYGNTGKQSEIRQRHADSIENIITRGYRASFQSFGNRILDAAAKSYRPEQRKALFGGYDGAVNNWIRAYTALKVTEISGTTFEQAQKIISDVVSASINQGLSEAATGTEIRKAIRDKSTLSVARSRVIARTETHAASQAGVQLAAESIEFPTKKVWISAFGERTREAHAEADGQVRDMNDPFIVGGEELMYPGDPTGSAAMVINCRCIAGIEVA